MFARHKFLLVCVFGASILTLAGCGADAASQPASSNDGEPNFWSLEELMEEIDKNKNDYPSDIVESINFYFEDAKKYFNENLLRTRLH